MDYVVGNPLSETSSSNEPVVKRFAGEQSLQSANSSGGSNRSKYLSQGRSFVEEQRKKMQDALDAQIASESGGSSIDLGEYGQIQLK